MHCPVNDIFRDYKNARATLVKHGIALIFKTGNRICFEKNTVESSKIGTLFYARVLKLISLIFNQEWFYTVSTYTDWKWRLVSSFCSMYYILSLYLSLSLYLIVQKVCRRSHLPRLIEFSPFVWEAARCASHEYLYLFTLASFNYALECSPALNL